MDYIKHVTPVEIECFQWRAHSFWRGTLIQTAGERFYVECDAQKFMDRLIGAVGQMPSKDGREPRFIRIKDDVASESIPST